MNLKTLQTFYLVVREGSLAAAAKKLNLSQPAVSRLVRVLEGETRLTLFSRTRRRLVLTREGELFFREAEHILQGVEEIPRIASDIRAKTTAELRVMTSPPIGVSLVAPALSLLHAEQPDLRCVADIGSRFDLENMVGTRRYDVGVASLPISHSLVKLNTEMLCRARTVAVVPEGHPLAVRREITADDFLGHSIIALRPNLLWRERIDDFFKAGGISPSYTMETQSTLIARRLVAEGVGIAVMDKIVGGSAVRDGVIEIPLAPERWVSYCYVFPAGQRPHANAALFIRALRRVVERLAHDKTPVELVKPTAADGAEPAAD